MLRRVWLKIFNLEILIEAHPIKCNSESKSLSRHSISLLHVNCFLNVYAAPTHPSAHSQKLVSNIACRFGKIELNPRKWINEITQNEMAYETFSITENVGDKKLETFLHVQKRF